MEVVANRKISPGQYGYNTSVKSKLLSFMFILNLFIDGGILCVEN